MSATLYGHDWARTVVKLTDCSSAGFRGRATGRPSPVGSVVALEIPGIGLTKARVIWASADAFGAKFMRPIDLASLDSTVAETSPHPARRWDDAPRADRRRPTA